MGSPELAYLIIEEETETISNRRINKIESILNKLNIKADEIKEMTLADIYNYGDNDCTGVKVTKKIGF